MAAVRRQDGRFWNQQSLLSRFNPSCVRRLILSLSSSRPPGGVAFALTLAMVVINNLLSYRLQGLTSFLHAFAMAADGDPDAGGRGGQPSRAPAAEVIPVPDAAASPVGLADLPRMSPLGSRPCPSMFASPPTWENSRDPTRSSVRNYVRLRRQHVPAGPHGAHDVYEVIHQTTPWHLLHSDPSLLQDPARLLQYTQSLWFYRCSIERQEPHAPRNPAIRDVFRSPSAAAFSAAFARVASSRRRARAAARALRTVVQLGPLTYSMPHFLEGDVRVQSPGGEGGSADVIEPREGDEPTARGDPRIAPMGRVGHRLVYAPAPDAGAPAAPPGDNH